MPASAPRNGWNRRHAIAIGALALLGLAVASLMADGGSLGFDRSLMLALRTPGAPDDPLGPRWFEDVMRDMTALGGIGVVIGASLVFAGYLARSSGAWSTSPCWPRASWARSW